MSDVRLLLGDCFERLPELADASVDAVVTDPPYGLSFMGKHWDSFDIGRRVGQRDVSKLGVRLSGDLDRPDARKPTARTASAFANAAGQAGDYDTSLTGNRRFQEWCCALGVELLRVLKPGGHALVFGGTRTHHRMTAGLEDAGFEIRDELQWLFGSGFPKSLNLEGDYEGRGTALKPAHEPIVLARKPLVGTVVATVLAHGTGALNIDACRIPPTGESLDGGRVSSSTEGWDRPCKRDPKTRAAAIERGSEKVAHAEALGRWPANVVLDEEAAALLDEQTGELKSGLLAAHHGRTVPRLGGNTFGHDAGDGATAGRDYYGDSGGASRFFYCAKVSRAERNAGLDDFDEQPSLKLDPTSAMAHDGRRGSGVARNHHPTVKPIELMRWLIRLVTPPDGLVLDPFVGSGSTGCAAVLEGVSFVGCEREPDYMRVAEARIAFWREHGERGLDVARARARRENDLAQQSLLGEDAA